MEDLSGMRPLEDTLLYEQQNHITEQIWRGKVRENVRCMHHDFDASRWPLSKRQWQMVEATGLQHLATCRKSVVDNMLIAALVERWRLETNTFHFQFGEATITLEDVSYIYGLPIDGEPLVGLTYNHDDHWRGLFNELLGQTPSGGDHLGSLVNSTWLHQTFGARLENPTEEEEKRQVRAFLLDLVGTQILANTSGARIYSFILQFFRSFERRSWATACLANLYRQLTICTGKGRSMGGNLTLLQYWAQLRMTIGACELTLEGGPFQYPLGQMFFAQTPQWVKGDLREYRQQFDDMDSFSFKWIVYRPILEQLQNNTNEEDAHMFTSCTLLLFMWIVESHNPDRVMKQFGLLQPVPPIFRRPPIRVLNMAKKSTDYSIKNKQYMDQWRDRLNNTIDGDDDGDQLRHTDEYHQWYDRVTVRSISIPSHKRPPKKIAPSKPMKSKGPEVASRLRKTTSSQSSLPSSSIQFQALQILEAIGQVAECITACSSIDEAVTFCPNIMELVRRCSRVISGEQAEAVGADEQPDTHHPAEAGDDNVPMDGFDPNVEGATGTSMLPSTEWVEPLYEPSNEAFEPPPW